MTSTEVPGAKICTSTTIVSINETKDGYLGTSKDKHLIWNSLSTAVVVGLHAGAGLRWGSVGVDVPGGEQLKYRISYTNRGSKDLFLPERFNLGE